MDNEDAGDEEIFDEPVEDEDLNQPPLPLCPNCLTPCSPRDYYCPHCGSNEALNPLASYMPFVRIRYEAGLYGRLWNKCWSPQTHLVGRIAYILFFVLFVPFLLIMGLPVLLYQKLRSQS